MTKKTLEQLQEEHSELCAQAAKLGMSVPEDLTIDFDSAEVGSTVVSNLEALIRKERAGVDGEGLADAADERHTAGDRSTASKTRARSKKKKPKVNPDQGETAGESTVTSNPKKTKAKKAVAKKAAKSTARRGAKKAKKSARGPRGEGKSAKVIEMMRRNGGVTREQVLKATGWKAVSMQQLAKAAGVKMKVDESEKPFRYYV